VSVQLADLRWSEREREGCAETSHSLRERAPRSVTIKALKDIRAGNALIVFTEYFAEARGGSSQ
jgi:hypothetical protein